MNTGASGGGAGRSSFGGRSLAKNSSRLGCRPSIAPNEMRPRGTLPASLLFAKSSSLSTWATISAAPLTSSA